MTARTALYIIYIHYRIRLSSAHCCTAVQGRKPILCLHTVSWLYRTMFTRALLDLCFCRWRQRQSLGLRKGNGLLLLLQFGFLRRPKTSRAYTLDGFKLVLSVLSLFGFQEICSLPFSYYQVFVPCILSVHCNKMPIFFSDRYFKVSQYFQVLFISFMLKLLFGNIWPKQNFYLMLRICFNWWFFSLQYSRNVSQSRWIIDDERMGEASVEVVHFVVIWICIY